MERLYWELKEQHQSEIRSSIESLNLSSASTFRQTRLPPAQYSIGCQTETHEQLSEIQAQQQLLVDQSAQTELKDLDASLNNRVEEKSLTDVQIQVADISCITDAHGGGAFDTEAKQSVIQSGCKDLQHDVC